MERRAEILLLSAILLFAFAVRIIGIGSPSFYYDEAGLLHSEGILLNQGVSAVWAFNEVQPVFSMLVSLMPVALLGFTEFAMRLPFAVFGTLMLLPVYFLARLWYDRRVAVFSALLLAVMPLHVIYSRFAFTDMIQVFFLLMAIWAMEHYLIKKPRNWLSWLFLAAMFFAFSFSTKYSTLFMWGLYWIFVFARQFREERKQLKGLLKSFLICHAIALLAILSFTGFRLANIFYMLYGIAFWSFSQSLVPSYTLAGQPFPYHFLVLIHALSPVFYLLVPVSFIYVLSKRKVRTRADYLLFFLMAAYLFVITLQARKFPRQLIFIMPLAAVILSRGFFAAWDRLKKPSRNALAAVTVLAVIVSLAWSLFFVVQLTEYRVWQDFGSYMGTLDADITIHTLDEYWPVDFYYVRQKSVRGLGEVDEGDVIVWPDYNSYLQPASPLQASVPFRKTGYDQSPVLLNAIRENAVLVHTVSHKDMEVLSIYRASRSFSPGQETEPLPRKNLFSFACGKIYSIDALRGIVSSSPQLSQRISSKCASLGLQQ